LHELERHEEKHVQTEELKHESGWFHSMGERRGNLGGIILLYRGKANWQKKERKS